MTKIVIAIFISSIMWVSPAFAKTRTLISQDKNDATKFAGDLAKSWKKVGDGVYSFDLDLSQEVEKGTNVNVGLVKKIIEKRLKRKFNASVNIVDNDTVKVTFKGSEEKFLRKVAKTKIKLIGDVEIAAASTVSDGGIRAKVAARAPKAGEVKAKIISVNGYEANVFIIAKGPTGLPKKMMNNHPYKFKITGEPVQAGDVWIFKVGVKNGNSWSVKTAK